LSTDVMLSPIEKILLARAHRVDAWMYEAFTSLATCNPMPKLEDLATIGWEAVARILWIRDKFPLIAQNTLCFRRDAIQCFHCSSSSDLINSSYGCGHISSGDAELTFSAAPISETNEHLPVVPLREIQCPICRENPFCSIDRVICNFCSFYTYNSSDVRVRDVTLNRSLKTMIEEMFSEEIKYYEPSLLDSF
jgi:hypothetical protein